MKKRLVYAVVLIISTFLGCSASVPVPMGGAAVPSQSPKPGKASGTTGSPTGETGDKAGNSGETTKKADVGATGKGEYGVSSENPMSIVTVPLATYFKAKEMAVFRIKLPETLKLFQAEKGRYPESQEEFMEEIIKKGQIELPQLKEGDSYAYDVPSHTLMIKTAKK
ncbi:MAG: hypothetical protein Q4G68_14220 [Planctomycetia bacterium]|nr:hypothetical protein [Planctomycetia bacterium]